MGVAKHKEKRLCGRYISRRKNNL